ncbi:YhcN/YlaJ family sporulation lipoprotein [Bacillus salacetis]|nr:YhcN/YlaJ family sporulation lipoprotein [Bacillus salacetis]
MTKLRFYLLVLLVILAGCNTNDNDLGQDGEDGGMGVQQVRYNTTNTGENNIYGEANPADPTYNMTDRMANKVMKLYEIERAYVYTKGEDAYAGVVLENRLETQLDDDLQRKIEEAVKSVNRNIQSVFISSDRELVRDMKSYRDRVHNGEPVDDFGERIDGRVSELFPNIQ